MSKDHTIDSNKVGGLSFVSSAAKNFGLFDLNELRRMVNSNLSNNNSSSRSLQTLSLLTLEFRDCQSGEFYDNSSEVCSACLPGTSLIFEDGVSTNTHFECRQCTNDRMLCEGGDQVGVRNGSWRLNRTADIFLPCKFGGACIGSEHVGIDRDGRTLIAPIGECSYPYKGTLCNTCEEGYGKSNDGAKCYNCKESYRIPLQIVGVVVSMVIFIIIGIKATYNVWETNPFREPIKRKFLMKRLAIFRILVTFLQILGLFGSVKANWEESLNSMLKLDETLMIAHSDAFGLDCAYALDSSKLGVEKSFVKLMLTNFMVVGYVVLSLIYWTIHVKCYRKENIRGNTYLVMGAKISIVVVLYNHVMNLIRQNMWMFVCWNLYRHDKPEYYLYLDLETKCWEGTHLGLTFGLALPILIIVMVSFPYRYLKVLPDDNIKYFDKLLNNDRFFVTAGLKMKKLDWEVKLFFFKIAIIAMAIFGSFRSDPFAIYMVTYVMIILIIVQSKTQPYQNPKLNLLERNGFVILLLINMFGIFFASIAKPIPFESLLITLGFMLCIVFFLDVFFEYHCETKYKIIDKIVAKFDLNSPEKAKMRRVRILKWLLGVDQPRDHYIMALNAKRRQNRIVQKGLNVRETENTLPTERRLATETADLMGGAASDRLEMPTVRDIVHKVKDRGEQ